jgi:hypothetical protein
MMKWTTRAADAALSSSISIAPSAVTTARIPNIVFRSLAGDLIRSKVAAI